MHIILQTHLIVGVLETYFQKGFSACSTIFQGLPEVPSHEAVGMAASASADVRKLYKIVNEILYPTHNFYMGAQPQHY